MSKSQQDRLLIVAIVVAACIVYLPTVMLDISASPHRYFTDVGNVQNALGHWRTSSATVKVVFPTNAQHPKRCAIIS